MNNGGDGSGNGQDSGDCAAASSNITSTGHNLFGSAHPCYSFGDPDFVAGSTDQITTNPLLGVLSATGYHPLLAGSPAIDHAGSTCPATDQRGTIRPQGLACDIGAYEYPQFRISGNAGTAGATLTYNAGGIKTVTADAIGNYSLAVPENWSGTVTVSKPGFTFSPASKNYVSVTSNLTGEDYTATRVAYAISGNAGKAGVKLTYHDGVDKTVTANGAGNYVFTIPLNWSGTVTPSLAGYRFTPVNKVYTHIAADIPAQNYAVYATVPTLLAPSGTIMDRTPAYQWTKAFGATQYQLQLLKGAVLVYTKSVPASACGATVCSNVPTSALLPGITYQWHVRAMINGVWFPYSIYKVFNIPSATPGFWKGYGLDFYVAPTGNKVQNFSIYIGVNGCGNYKITNIRAISISKEKFAFTGHFYASGTFNSLTSTSGSLGLSYFYISGCGYVSGGPFAWKAKWQNSSQAAATFMTAQVTQLLVPPGVDTSLADYTVERVGP